LDEYREAKLLLSGSHTECQPLALLDANATGTPFVARKTGCIARMPGGVAVESVGQMAKQIDLICSSDGLWHSLSAAGRKAAGEIYNPARTTEMLLNVLLNDADTKVRC
jgi:glycosyltransferase involved in cell wall biosynthesis